MWEETSFDQLRIINIFNNSKLKNIRRKKIAESIHKTLIGEGVKRANVNVILTDDKHIRELNNSYLKHNYTTDVISFRLDEKEVEGEIYINVVQAGKQSVEYKVSVTNELQRLAVHGTLHLLGYDDDTSEKRLRMHELENKYISN